MSSDRWIKRVFLKAAQAVCSAWLWRATNPSSIVVGNLCAASFMERFEGSVLFNRCWWCCSTSKRLFTRWKNFFFISATKVDRDFCKASSSSSSSTAVPRLSLQQQITDLTVLVQLSLGKNHQGVPSQPERPARSTSPATPHRVSRLPSTPGSQGRSPLTQESTFIRTPGKKDTPFQGKSAMKLIPPTFPHQLSSTDYYPEYTGQQLPHQLNEFDSD